MKRFIFLAAVGLFICTFGTTQNSAQQVPGRGFSVLLCLVEQAPLPGSARIGVNVDFDLGPDAEGFGLAQLTLTHGQSGSTHLVAYFDVDESGFLNCGDLIVSVT